MSQSNHKIPHFIANNLYIQTLIQYMVTMSNEMDGSYAMQKDGILLRIKHFDY